jgi:hypothetical protein
MLDPTFPPESQPYSNFSCPNVRCPSRGPRGTTGLNLSDQWPVGLSWGPHAIEEAPHGTQADATPIPC